MEGMFFKTLDAKYLPAAAFMIIDFLLAYTNEMVPQDIYEILIYMMNKKRYSEFYSTIKELSKVTQEYLIMFCNHFQKLTNKNIELNLLIELYANYFIRPPKFNLMNLKEADELNLKLFENIVTILITDNKDDFTYENDVECSHDENFSTDVFLEVQPYFHEKTVKYINSK
ncbi:hypothetical protein RF11_13717 [Thelohanellus kitauei]|uniref:Uncharacterized protein n=1 Tax=Thelohanellus kitauei TaxID=669202 RepID=A0A0C2IZZ8_THEKT|nr:hypothetical protein RF11_13717 [Thelohanellus kitauei]